MRIDYINTSAGSQLIPCNDGRPGPCSRTAVPFSMADRVSDISSVLDRLPAWLACVPVRPRGDDPRCWPELAREKRVKAIMGLAIGGPPITFGADLSNVRVPSLLVAGTLDNTSPQAVSVEAFDRIATRRKAFTPIENATHRSFDSTYCDQTQAAGAIARDNLSAMLDLHTIQGIVNAPTSGKAMDYCPFSTFTNPTDIRDLVASLTGFDVTLDNVPTTRLTIETPNTE